MYIGAEQYNALLCARLLAGFAHGIAYTTTITHAVENLVSQIRARTISIVNYMIITSAFTVTIIFASSITQPYDRSDQYLAIISIIYSLLGLIMVPFFTYESIPNLLRLGYDQEALVTMMKLRNEIYETTTVRCELQQLKLMLHDDIGDQENGANVFTGGNFRPLLLIAAYRALAFFSSNILLNGVMIGLVQMALDRTVEASYWSAVILTSIRFAVALVPIFILDAVPRKKLLSITGALSVIILLVYSLFSVTLQFEKLIPWLPAVFCGVYQMIAALGVDPLHHVVTAEAFNSSTKSLWSLVTVTTLENVLHVVSILLYLWLRIDEDGDDEFTLAILFTSAFAILILHLLLEFYAPETKGLDLRQTRRSFRSKAAVNIVNINR